MSCTTDRKGTQGNGNPSVSQRHFSPDAVKLNNKAMDLMREVNLQSTKPTLAKVEPVITLLDSAIAMDSTYYVPYANKASVLLSINDLDGAISCERHVAAIFEDRAEAEFFLLGMMYDAKSDAPQANILYAKSLRLCQNHGSVPENIGNIEFEAVLYRLLNKNDSANYLLSYIKTRFSADTLKMTPLGDLTQPFDRRKFVKSYLHLHE